MGRRTVTRLQVSGHRFLLRRMAHALVRGDVRMLDDPLRAQTLSMAAGCALAVLVVAGCVIFAHLRPGAATGDAPIVMDRASGALYVRIDDTLHPVPNLASARLVVGAPGEPRPVGRGAIAGARRGPSVGIAGAPSAIGPALSSGDATWTVCDAESATTRFVGPVEGVRPLDGGSGVLVSAGATATYLVYEGWRARVDLRERAVVQALGLDGVVPRPVSRAVLEALPEAPPIAAPRIAGAGAPGPAALPGLTVGTVVRLARAGTVEHYVVLAGGVQRLGDVAADLIRFTVAQPAGDIPTVAADAVAAVPMLDAVPVGTFPGRIRAVASPVLCAGWSTSGGGRTNTRLLVGDSAPSRAPVVDLAQADGEGAAIDAVAVPAGRSVYVRSVPLTGDGPAAGALFLLDDLGVLFGIRDAEAAKSLGLPEDSVPAPWPMLSLLPRGPELSRAAASVLRDSVPA